MAGEHEKRLGEEVDKAKFSVCGSWEALEEVKNRLKY